MKTEVTISIDSDSLTNVTDEHLVCLWAVSQANPASMDGWEPGAIAEYVAREIVQRFVARTGLPLWNHQGKHAFAWALAKHCPGKWVDGEFVPNSKEAADVLRRDAL